MDVAEAHRAALERAFTEIVRRHEAWRTTFEWRDDGPVQIDQPPPARIEIPFTDLRQLPQAKREAEAQTAPDGAGLVSVGFDYVGAGQYPKGIPLIEQGIKKDSLKYPDDAKLHLGIAYFHANQKPKALAALKSVGGTDGTADLARVWTLFINTPPGFSRDLTSV